MSVFNDFFLGTFSFIKEGSIIIIIIIIFFFRATYMAYGSTWASGQIGAINASLRHSHSNFISEQCLRPTPKLIATPDP